MLFDNIILFLNVLEQFAIRVTIFGLSIEEIITSFNHNWFTNNDDYIQNLKNFESNNNPYDIINVSKKTMDSTLYKSVNFYEKLIFVNNPNVYVTTKEITFIY
jgi:hypothetical protein